MNSSNRRVFRWTCYGRLRRSDRQSTSRHSEGSGANPNRRLATVRMEPAQRATLLVEQECV
jgi:hypothetical protein